MNTINDVRKGLGPQSEVEKNGVEKPKALTLKDVEGLVKRDLHSCMLMLQAIHDDVDVLGALAVVLHGKYMNARHKQELEAQTEIAPN